MVKKMSFFSKLTKKATETIEFTKEKATNISEELKIKGKISEAKEKIEELYKEIGEKVYSDIKSDVDVAKEDILPKIEEITNLNEQIEKLETDILAIKKIKKCDNCGTDLELDADFCSKCGKKQPKVEQVEIKEENPEAKDAEVVEVKNIENEDNNVENSEENNNESNGENSYNEENNNQ